MIQISIFCMLSLSKGRSIYSFLIIYLNIIFANKKKLRILIYYTQIFLNKKSNISNIITFLSIHNFNSSQN